MIKRYITYTALGFILTLGWNIFLVQRDDRMFKAYYHQKAIQEQQR